jgi:arsenate reductase
MEKEAAFFKVLSDPTRLRLVIILAVKGELCVCKLSEALRQPQYKISRHLGILRRQGLVEARREGTWMYYQLRRPSGPVEACLWDCFKTCFLEHPEAQEDLQRLSESHCSEPLTEKENPCMDEKKKLRILFLCTGNSCRSQMAEGWARHLKGDCVEPYSAGIETHGLNPYAVKVMAEAGVDISAHRSKHLEEVRSILFDYVITVCDHAHESCPLFPGRTRVIHAGFEDPPRLAQEAKTEEEVLNCYRRVRDQIRSFVEQIPDILQKKEAP